MKTQFNAALYLFLLMICITRSSNAQSPDWMWARSIGGSASDEAFSVATDANGNFFVTGCIFSNWVYFDTILLSQPPNGNMFLAKYDSSENALWVRASNGYAGGDARGYSVATDNNGNSVVAGTLYGTTIFGNDTLLNYGNTNMFIVKYDAAGNLLWSRSGIGNFQAFGNSTAMDANGNIYVTGSFVSTWQSDSITFGSVTLTVTGALAGANMFMVKYDPSGNVIWAKSAGAGNYEDCFGKSIAIDNSGNILVAGDFSDEAIFGTDTLFNPASNNNFFIASYDDSGNFLWAKNSYGHGEKYVNAICVDFSGNIFFTGYFSDTLVVGADTLISPAFHNLYLLKCDGAGNALWMRGSSGIPGMSTIVDNRGYSIAADNSGNVVITGAAWDSIFTFGAITLSKDQFRDIFIAKCDSSGNVLWAKMEGGSNNDYGYGVAIDNIGNTILTGSYRSNSFYFGPFWFNNPTSLNHDLFIAKTGNCSARFILYPDTIIPHNWFAINHATGAAPLTYLWNWGDSTTSTGATPSHIYNTPGYYNICLTITDSSGCTSSYCDSSTYIYRGNNENSVITINVILPGTTSIQEQNANQNTISISPNPSSGIFTIIFPENFQKENIEIYSVFGEKVYSRKIDNNFPKEIKLKNISSGIYFVKVFDREKSYCKKLIVE